MAIQYQKTKSVAKQIVTKGTKLESLVLSTMKTISDIVGATLGPGGQPVLIERFEHNLPPVVTKDGVSVMRALGMDDPSAQCIMECARDAAVRTVNEAGDGTTTSAVLSEAIVRHLSSYCKNNPKESPQKVVRQIESLFKSVIEPTIKSLTIGVDSLKEEGQKLLKSVAQVSANGDEELAKAVLECFELVGDEGNVTISEVSGPSGYEVTAIEGFPIGIGYEDCCMNFFPKFINEPGTQRTVLENPVFIIYFGPINDINQLLPLIKVVGTEAQNHVDDPEKHPWSHHNVVVCATGFSNSVLGTLGVNFGAADSVKYYPLVAPKSPFVNGQLEFLYDVAAITGAKVFDQLNNPLDKGVIEDLGPGVKRFEATRFRSAIIGWANEDLLTERVATLEQQLLSPGSDLEVTFLKQRIAKLTGGIASLKVIGASNGELKEKRDRAEDAVCAVRGAIRHGCLPGGGWTLIKVAAKLAKEVGGPVVSNVLVPALWEPVNRLLSNCGLSQEEASSICDRLFQGVAESNNQTVYDALEHRFGEAVDLGILDSTPAVLEAIRNSISIASLLGTLGGTVVFKRDHELERAEAREAADWERMDESNPANERA